MDKPRTRAGTWRVFERRYTPQYMPDGSLIRDTAPTNANPRHVWTVLDCDGKLYVNPGYHCVNRLGYVLTAQPWTDAEYSNPGYLY